MTEFKYRMYKYGTQVLFLVNETTQTVLSYVLSRIVLYLLLLGSVTGTFTRYLVRYCTVLQSVYRYCGAMFFKFYGTVLAGF